MRRREFLLGAAAAVAASSPLAALAADGPPLTARRIRRLDDRQSPRRGAQISRAALGPLPGAAQFNDLWTPGDKRAFLMTPRQEFCLPKTSEDAYVGHYLDIGFGVTITPPGTMGRMTSAIEIRAATRCSKSAPARASSRRC